MRLEFVQTSMGIIGSLGFALLFGIRGTKLLGCNYVSSVSFTDRPGQRHRLDRLPGQRGRGTRQSIWHAGVQPGHCRMQ